MAVEAEGAVAYSLPKTRDYVPDIASRTTGRTAEVRNAVIDDIASNELSGVQFTYKPEYNPFLAPLGVAKEGAGSQIGPRAFQSASPRTAVAGTLVHAELHHRLWARGIPGDHHTVPAVHAYFNKVMERFARRKGWPAGTGQ